MLPSDATTGEGARFSPREREFLSVHIRPMEHTREATTHGSGPEIFPLGPDALRVMLRRAREA